MSSLTRSACVLKRLLAAAFFVFFSVRSVSVANRLRGGIGRGTGPRVLSLRPTRPGRIPGGTG